MKDWLVCVGVLQRNKINTIYRENPWEIWFKEVAHQTVRNSKYKICRAHRRLEILVSVDVSMLSLKTEYSEFLIVQETSIFTS